MDIKHSKKESFFHEFRYQIVPIGDKYIQTEFFPNIINTKEDLIKNKNKIFYNLVTKLKDYTAKSELNIDIKFDNNRFVILRMAAKRELKRNTKDFKLEKIDNWPFIIIIIDNDPMIQKIYIQSNKKAFKDYLTVKNILENTFNEKLQLSQLHISIESIYDEQQFWDLIKKYDTKLLQVRFELITPNLSNISKTLTDELKNLSKLSNAIKTDIIINSEKNSSLKIDENNDTIKDLVDYSSQGGGNISIKARGYSKMQHTKKYAKEKRIDELEISGQDKKTIIDIIKNLLE